MDCDRRLDQKSDEEEADFGSPQGRSGDHEPAPARGEDSSAVSDDDYSATSDDDDSAWGDECSADSSIGAHG